MDDGWILAESLPIVLPIDADVFGGPDARGGALATRFWLAIAEFAKDADGNKLNPPQNVSGLNPFRPSGTNPIAKPPPGAFGMTPDGYRWSSDGLFQVGGFWLPVPPALSID